MNRITALLSSAGGAAILCLANTAGAVPSSGFLDIAGVDGFDVYYETFVDTSGNPNFCPPGPLANCSLTIDGQTTPAIGRADAQGSESLSGQTFDVNEFDDESGTWSYTLGDPPQYATAWITKDGSAQDLLTLHYIVTPGSTTYSAYTAAPGVLYPYLAFNSCGPNNEPADLEADCDLGGLSNIIWFDTGTQNPPEEIPEPNLLALLGLMFVGVGVALKRRN